MNEADRWYACMRLYVLGDISSGECTRVSSESHRDVLVYRTVDLNGSGGMNDSE